MSSRNRKVAKYRKPIKINIGMVIFMIIIVYILAYTITYLNKPKISIYEVAEKKIADNNICKGIILRNETVVYTENAGSLNYYFRNGERASKNALIYTIDEKGEFIDKLNQMNQDSSLTKDDIADIQMDIQSFKTTFTDSSFNEVYNFKYNIENTIFDLTNVNIINNLDDAMKNSAGAGTYQAVYTKESGIITYFIDSMESYQAEDVTAEMINSFDSYKREPLRTDKTVKKGKPVYKIITSEDWSIIVNLTKEQYDELQDKNRIQITFVKDNLTTTAGFTPYKKGEDYLAKITLDKYMIRYINERYLDIELAVNSAEGLKIPITSVDERDFFKIPLEYFTEGGDSDKKGVIKEIFKENGDTTHLFIPADIYYEEDGYGYIDNSQLALGDTILLSGTSTKYKIDEIGKLKGAYNVNKGYSVFRRIEIIYGNEEYYIIKKDTELGLKVYDYIVLDASTIIK